MAGFMDNVNKGFAAINVKAGNIKESSKLRAAITTREDEIAAILKNIGETVFVNRNNFRLEMVEQQVADIKSRYDEIEKLKEQINALEAKEKDILGGGEMKLQAKIFCAQCGAPNKLGGKFCEKCGSQLVQ